VILLLQLSSFISAATSCYHSIPSWIAKCMSQHWETGQCACVKFRHLVSALATWMFAPGRYQMSYVWFCVVAKYSIHCAVSWGCVSMCFKEAWDVWTITFCLNGGCSASSQLHHISLGVLLHMQGIASLHSYASCFKRQWLLYPHLTPSVRVLLRLHICWHQNSAHTHSLCHILPEWERCTWLLSLFQRPPFPPHSRSIALYLGPWAVANRSSGSF